MLVQYVSPPMSTLTQKNVKIPKLLYWPTVLCGPLLVVRGDLAKIRGIYNIFYQSLPKKNVIFSHFSTKKCKFFNARKKSRQTRALINAKKNAHNFSKKNSKKNFIAKKDKKNAPIIFLKSTI